MNVNTFNAILSGWKNVIFKNKDIEELAIVRAKICSSCPHANKKYKFKPFRPTEGEETKSIEGLACNVCGCPLSAKVRQVLENCPEDRW